MALFAVGVKLWGTLTVAVPFGVPVIAGAGRFTLMAKEGSDTGEACCDDDTAVAAGCAVGRGRSFRLARTANSPCSLRAPGSQGFMRAGLTPLHSRARFSFRGCRDFLTGAIEAGEAEMLPAFAPAVGCVWFSLWMGFAATISTVLVGINCGLPAQDEVSDAAG